VRELATLTSMVTVATILVVDDEPRIVQLVRDYLEHGGFTVLTASDGQAALRTARTGRPDLVVLDLGLPGLDGLDVARSLRGAGAAGRLACAATPRSRPPCGRRAPRNRTSWSGSSWARTTTCPSRSARRSW